MSASKKFLKVKQEMKELSDFKKKQEEGIQKKSKLQLLAELSSGIAHNINNHITCMSAASAIICNILEESSKADNTLDSEKDEKLKKYAQKINDHTTMTARIVKSMRLLSRSKEIPEPERVSISLILRSAIDLIDEFCRMNDIKIYKEVSDNHIITCHPEKALQVFLNLLQNSCEAIYDKEEKWIRIESQAISNGIKIFFTDSGNGIPKEVQEKMMTPFYTTKTEGNGIGLSLSQKMMDSQGGNIFYNEEAPNTQFVLFFKS
jgi:C4-dicarboxylate-specific signal transduction histidine kinase